MAIGYRSRSPPLTPASVTLAAMMAAPALAGMAMLRQSRLSVSPVSAAEWAAVVALAGG